MLTRVSFIAAAVAAAFATLSVGAIAADQPAQANPYAAPQSASATDFIEVFAKLNGKTPGYRKGHARGVCAAGEFVPSAAARQRFATPLFAVDKAPLIMRFSMGGGNPNADERRGARGLGIQFQLDDNQFHHIAGLTVPLFAGKNPQQFLGLLQWSAKIQAGEATPADLQKYFAANPEMQAQREWSQGRQASAEYTSSNYYGIHAFFADQPNAAAQAFRWQLEPVAGEQQLTAAEVESLPPSFLDERLTERLKKDGMVVFNWVWTLAEPGDATNNPAQLWPADRERVTVGTITVTSSGSDQCEPVNFDPMRVALGISPSDDPVLPIRSVAYAISQGMRLNNQ